MNAAGGAAVAAVIVLPLILTIVGLLVYALAGNPKVSEIGRITFQIGLFWTVYLFLGRTFRF